MSAVTRQSNRTSAESVRDSATETAEAIRRSKLPGWKDDFTAAVQVMENASRQMPVEAPPHGFYCPVRCWCDKADR